MKLSIVIPCYNEGKNIPLLLDRFQRVVGKRDMEVILVDNGSTDGSSEILKELLPRYEFARTVTVPVNKGYGYGILKGLEASKGEYVGWTHADLQTDPADVVRAYDALSKEKEPIYLKGLRKGRPCMDRFFTYGMGIFESVSFGMPMWDINGQPNLFPREFYEKWKKPPYDFSLDLYAFYWARREGMRVVRLPVRFSERLYGHSKWNTGLKAKWMFIKRTVTFSKELKRAVKGGKMG